jgi:hypothetical protein
MKSLVVFLLFVGSCTYYIKDGRRVCDRYDTVETVGGCSQSGYCRVRYTSGRLGDHFKPVPGETSCVESHWER